MPTLVGKMLASFLPEGEEPRILQATKRLVKETEVIPVLLGNPDKIKIYLEIEGIMKVTKSSIQNIAHNLKIWSLHLLNVVKEND